MVPESAVIGRAFVIIWPPSRWRILPIPATFTQPALNGSHASAAPPSVQAQGTDLLPARVEPTGQAIPLTLGFAGAIPLTWLQRRVRAAGQAAPGRRPGGRARPGRRPARRWRPARRRPVGPR